MNLSFFRSVLFRRFLIFFFIAFGLCLCVFFIGKDKVLWKSKFVLFHFLHREVVQLPSQSLQSFPNQFVSTYGSFSLITRTCPYYASLHSRASKRGDVYFMNRVDVLFATSNYFLVSQYPSHTLLGYVSKGCVAFASDFQPVSSFDRPSFSYTVSSDVSQYLVRFSVSSEGFFTASWKSISGGILMRESLKGRFYEFQNMYYAKPVSSEPYHWFFYEDESWAFFQDARGLNRPGKLILE